MAVTGANLQGGVPAFRVHPTANGAQAGVSSGL